MKLKLTMHLDIPEEGIGSSNAEIRQNIFDAIVNKLVCSYLEDAMHMASRGVEPQRGQLIAYYNTWADAISSSEWSIEKEPEELFRGKR